MNEPADINDVYNVLEAIRAELGKDLIDQRYDAEGRKVFNVGALSFRDQCAIAAMNTFDWLYCGPTSNGEHARKCFDLADAMSLERQKRTESRTQSAPERVTHP